MPDTTLIRVKVKAHARKDSVTELPDGRLFITVRVPAEEGLANEKVLALLAVHLRVSPGRLSIIRGRTSPTKTIIVS